MRKAAHPSLHRRTFKSLAGESFGRLKVISEAVRSPGCLQSRWLMGKRRLVGLHAQVHGKGAGVSRPAAGELLGQGQGERRGGGVVRGSCMEIRPGAPFKFRFTLAILGDKLNLTMVLRCDEECARVGDDPI